MPPNLNKRLLVLIILGFFSILFFTVVSLFIAISGSVSLQKKSHSMLEDQIPYMVHLMDLDRQIFQSVNNLNAYIITGDHLNKARFDQSMKQLKKLIDEQSKLSEADYKSTSLMKVIYFKYKDKADELIAYRSNDSINFQGISLAGEKLNPYHLRFYGNLNEIIEDELGESLLEDNDEVLVKLFQLKTSWTDMIMSLRTYFITRTQSHYELLVSLKDDNIRFMDEFKSYQNDPAYEDVFFEELFDLHATFMANLPEVLEVFRSDKWRWDTYLMQQEITPITENLQKMVRTMVFDKRLSTKKRAESLSQELDSFFQETKLILLVAFVVMLIIISFVIAKIRRLLARCRIEEIN